MEMNQILMTVAVTLSCLLIASVYCADTQQAESDSLVASHPQKRSVADLYPTEDEDALDKRSSLLRFGKRSSLLRFGKRSSLLRFGKRSSLLRFGKRGSMLRYGKRADDFQGEEEAYPAYPDVYLSEGDLKRAVKSFHWGRESDE